MNSILANQSLKPFNTFGVEARARHLIQTNSIEGLRQALALTLEKQLPWLILGGGSNILFTRDFDGVVIQPLIMGIDQVAETPQTVTLRVGAGVEWDSLVEYAVGMGWGGLENLSLIPGLVGASPIQNIGAYGVEVKERITRVEYLNPTSGGLESLLAKACKFGYRDSIFKTTLKGRAVITHVHFQLLKHPILVTHYGPVEEELGRLNGHTIAHVRQAVANIRRAKLPNPKVLGNAGSFFRNPTVGQEALEHLRARYGDVPHFPAPSGQVKIPAAWLIERCGWKGKRVGNVGVHAHQALVLVNHGGATGAEILALGQTIQRAVRDELGIRIEPEVQVV